MIVMSAIPQTQINLIQYLLITYSSQECFNCWDIVRSKINETQNYCPHQIHITFWRDRQ